MICARKRLCGARNIDIMRSFGEKERSCEITFQKCLPCWHTYTSGKETPVIFANDNDMALVMNIIAQAAYLFTGKAVIIAFAVMNNHLHFVLSGDGHWVNEMMSFILKRIRRVFGQNRTFPYASKPIEDINSMRNHIAYVHRNGYVANHNYTPFSYPWGSGAYYFMPERTGTPFSRITSIYNRSMFRSRDVKLPPDWQVLDGHVAPPSFCDMAMGMAMFRDAHHYFASVSKNVEACSEIAVELDDGEFLTDQELFAQLLKIVREKYCLVSTKDLTGAQRLDLARTLHYDYRSSNGQIRRILGLSQYEVDNLFPMGK